MRMQFCFLVFLHTQLFAGHDVIIDALLTPRSTRSFDERIKPELKNALEDLTFHLSEKLSQEFLTLSDEIFENQNLVAWIVAVYTVNLAVPSRILAFPLPNRRIEKSLGFVQPSFRKNISEIIVTKKMVSDIMKKTTCSHLMPSAMGSLTKNFGAHLGKFYKQHPYLESHMKSRTILDILAIQWSLSDEAAGLRRQVFDMVRQQISTDQTGCALFVEEFLNHPDWESTNLEHKPIQSFFRKYFLSFRFAVDKFPL